MCDAGVQYKGSEVPEGGAGSASLRPCVQPEEHGGRGGEHPPKSGTHTLIKLTPGCRAWLYLGILHTLSMRHVSKQPLRHGLQYSTSLPPCCKIDL